MKCMKKNALIVSFVLLAAVFTIFMVGMVFGSNKTEPDPDPASNGNIPVSGEDQGPQGNGFSQGLDNPSDLQKPSGIPQPQPGDVTPPIETSKIHFLAVGDNIIHSSVFEDALLLAKGTDKEYDFVPMYSEIRQMVENADLAFINQEGPIAGKDEKFTGYPQFNAPDEAGDALVEIGFDIVNLANNHMLDRGEEGYRKLTEFWRSKPVTSIGAYLNQEEYNTIQVIEKNGISIALLSYTYGTNGLMLPASSEYVIPWNDKDEIDRQTKEARKLADIVIVSIHWGIEDNFEPNSTQKELCDVMVNNGVDVVLGHHPHVLQPIEWRDRPDGGRTLVAYSLGNLISTMMYSRNMVGGILTFDIEKLEGERAFVTNALFTPTVTYYNSIRRGLKIYKFSDYTAELQAKHGTNQYESGKSLSTMRKIVDTTIAEEFLPDEYLDQ